MEIYCESDRTEPGLPLKADRCGTMTPDWKRNTWLHFSTWLQFNCSMTFDVLGQRLYGPPLRVTHNIPVLLKSSSSVAMTQLASFERRWHCHISRAAAALRRLLLPCPRINRTPDVKDLL